MGMQSKDGGFAAFDADNNSTWLNQLPLADVEAVTDPSCPDLTGRVLEMMASVGYRADHPVASRAIEWLKKNQYDRRVDGGDAGASTISMAPSRRCRACARSASTSNEPWIKRAVAWLKSKQNPDGGWGESPLSRQGSGVARARDQHRVANRVGADRIARGRGRAQRACDARRAMALRAAERRRARGTRRELTGNGFPNHFYLRYHMYAHYFPLMALGRFRKRLGGDAPRLKSSLR